ncbi:MULTISPECIES: TIM barrel protein [unclassified Arcicella]|uniref:sugar phosphate isomerase/epimerase family protein n=1 Tax=unclassified Arcicella TaxID=2644986 RepID=UPI002861689A|nr:MULTISPECIES: TIM barrel protein [unclassified Arcicella]MDR6562289.1 sugar phosphate isomerase/epimerase [Arcicella sp. BE51]MDR6812016.1 sugar phosphate isomerase/epimerase [Arcicella sp. BE140]MDR6823327.1 sugar phosphate isomerase/epimerase [Arcicella sp. BE139]
MKLKFYAPHWGNTLPFHTFCQNVKSAGYDGVEMHLPFEEDEKQEILSVLKDFELEFIGQYWQSHEKNIDEHAQNYEKYLKNLIAANPIFINCQTGKDYFSFEQNKQLFDLARSISQETGVPIIHETHRGKSLFAAHITYEYLTKIPDLRICLDISHWCNVHESLLDDQQEAVTLAIDHANHIHSRVGHPEGPQVNDPRAPEWKETLDTHLAWWDKVVATHEKKGTQPTVTTEFGPATYMPVLPYTQMPVANQWEINVYMMNLLKERYNA